VQLSDNGHMAFGGGSDGQNVNTAIPNGARPNGIIAPYWDDLIIGNEDGPYGSLKYETRGTAPSRKFVATWDAPIYGWFWPGIPYFQVILEESTNDIVFEYRNAGHEDGRSATIGVESVDGTHGTQFSYDKPVLKQYERKKGIRFTNRSSG